MAANSGSCSQLNFDVTPKLVELTQLREHHIIALCETFITLTLCSSMPGFQVLYDETAKT